MKGIIFTEFLDMVEDAVGYETVDQLITENDLPSNGVYTSIGTYDHSEMVILLMALSKKTSISVSELLHAFGQYMFGTFEKNYASFLDAAPDAFSFLESIEKYIHVEVKKLYPDAELPRFETKRVQGNTLEMIYYSDRRMSDFALGLIEKAMQYYEEEVTIDRKFIKGDGSEVLFTISRSTAILRAG